MKTEKLNTLFTRQINRNHVYNMAVGLQTGDGRLDYTWAGGYADAERTTPMTTDTPYYIASIAKTYTAAIAMRLFQQGQLDLEAPIAEYVPAEWLVGLHTYKGQDRAHTIRVHQLIDQTSGLADYFEGRLPRRPSLFDELKQGHDRKTALDEKLALVRQMKPVAQPGARAHYSDTNYQLLGAILERVSGQAYSQLVQELICQPLGLRHTYVFEGQPRAGEATPAIFYFRERPLHLPGFMSSIGPDGGIVSTLAESLVFVRAFFAGQVFDASLLSRMTAQWRGIFFPIEYGYGLMRYKLPRWLSPFQAMPAFIGHAGASGSWMFACPERDLYLVGTVNQASNPGRPFQLMSRMVNVVR